MSIRPYREGDEKKLDPNRFSGVDDIAGVFSDDSFVKHTLDDDGEIKCITCWKQYAPRHYAAFFLMPEGISISNAKALKRFIVSAVDKFKAKTCITYSVDCDMLNRWHEFLGFENQRKPLDEQAQGFNRWIVRWD